MGCLERAMPAESAELWIGLFESEVTDGCAHFDNATYAAVNAVALAQSQQEFVTRVWNALEVLGLRCIECESVERYQDRIEAGEVHDSIKEGAEHAMRDGGVAFGTFHTTDEDVEVEN